ncbi:MAG: hypothetical protein ABSH50_17540 [Bryobacteraceae bacterium]|jgi:hypothetical protein
MRSLKARYKTILQSLAVLLLFVSVASAQSAKLGWIKPSLIGLPPARCCAPMVYDAAMGATILYGGASYTTVFGETWAFSRATGWKQLAPAVSPPPLTSASMAYDPTTETVVLFGGLLNSQVGGTPSNETWTWDGVTWTQQFPPVSPSPRSWNINAMVFDSKLGKVLMFGGSDNETWEWDGTGKAWTQQFPAHSPSARAATLAYDENTNQVILFGGVSATLSYTYYGDTWTYNGVDWVQQQPATLPPARCDNGLAFDPILKSVVLFGGLAGPCEDCGEGRLNDTWLWGGSNWIGVQTSRTPTPSSGTSFDYDATAGGMLLFGGWVSSSAFTNSTWFLEAQNPN